jgi:hypothetical protein
MPIKDPPVVKAILKGQLATFEVAGGGFVRAPAPHDGLLIEATTTTLFLPASEVARLLAELPKQHPARRPSQPALER